MSKSIEELRKMISEQEAALLIKEKQQLLNTMEQEALEKLKIRLVDEEGLDEPPSMDILQQMYKKLNKTFELEYTNEATKNKIFENFAKEFGKENLHGNALGFTSIEAADDFFRRQAKEGHQFLGQQVNCDNYFFSDGTGHYKSGTKADIISYCKDNSLANPFEPKVTLEQEENNIPRNV